MEIERYTERERYGDREILIQTSRCLQTSCYPGYRLEDGKEVDRRDGRQKEKKEKRESRYEARQDMIQEMARDCSRERVEGALV